MNAGRCRRRRRSWPRTSSIRTSLMSHFERTISVAQSALRAMSATARSWSTTPSRRVDQDERDVRALRRLERTQLRVVLDALAVAALAAQARGVDEHEGAVAALEHGVDRVAGRPGDLGDDQALAAEQLVDEARLADVRAAEDRDADRVVGGSSGRSWPPCASR